MRIEDHGDGVKGVTFTFTADDNFITSANIAAFARRWTRYWRRPASGPWCSPARASIFCAGRVGVKGLTSAADMAADLGLILEVNTRLRTSKVPFVAAVEGKAFGFGCGFSTQCDVTIAGEGARFALPEMSHRLPPLIVLSYFGKFVPFKRAFELALTSREFGAAEAREIGVVTEVVPKGGALARAIAFAKEIAAMDEASVQMLRTFARRVAGLSDDHDARTASTRWPSCSPRATPPADTERIHPARGGAVEGGRGGAMDETILFIGVGRMGGLMAERLIAAGYSVAVADLSDEALAPFRDKGVPAAPSGADLPGRIVVTMLPTDVHVRAALLGEGGAVGRIPREVVIDMSTAARARPRASRPILRHAASR